MNDKIIDQMRKIVDDILIASKDVLEYLRNDSENDFNVLKDYDGVFIWHVRKSGTALSKISPVTLIESAKENESMRYWLMREVGNEPYIFGDPDGRFFIYNRCQIAEVSRGEYVDFYKSCISEAVKGFKRIFPELKTVDKPIKIVFTCGLSYVMEQIRFAQSIGDKTLLEQLRSFRRWCRHLNNHEIWIGKDFSDHGFTFSERRNGDWGICGGILFYSGAWHMHT